jgi:hypothetical protein
MEIDLWINSEVAIFRVDKNTSLVTSLGYSTISRVWWQAENKGRVKLYGNLLISKELNNIQNGDTIEVLRKECGPRDRYDNNEVAIRLNNCQVKRKWMIDLNPDSPDNQEITRLYISLTCDVEFLL